MILTDRLGPDILSAFWTKGRTSVHYKPTDSHSYLLHSSSHPSHVKNSIPYSQFLRLRRLCSDGVISHKSVILSFWLEIAGIVHSHCIFLCTEKVNNSLNCFQLMSNRMPDGPVAFAVDNNIHAKHSLEKVK